MGPVRGSPGSASAITGAATTGGRGRRRPGLHLPLRRDRRAAPIAAGCEPVIFDPRHRRQRCPPGTAGIYLGGGFPEVHAAELAGNASLRARRSGGDRGRASDGGRVRRAAVPVPHRRRRTDGRASSTPTRPMSPRLTLRLPHRRSPTMIICSAAAGTPGDRARVPPDHGDAGGRSTGAGWLLEGVPTASVDPADTGTPPCTPPTCTRTGPGTRRWRQRFADAVHAYAGAGRPTSGAAARIAARRRHKSRWRITSHEDLHHHGDADIAEGLVDLAVNVRIPTPPDWLAEVIRGHRRRRWPPIRDPTAALAAIAAAHRRAGGAGAADGRRRRGVHPAGPGPAARTAPVVVHPQFTEPEAALRAAGHRPQPGDPDREHGFAWIPTGFRPTPTWSIIGNPTNPTGVLHPAALLRRADPARPAAGGRRGVHGRGAGRAGVADRRRDAGV